MQKRFTEKEMKTILLLQQATKQTATARERERERALKIAYLTIKKKKLQSKCNR
jgi:hypothetical protein